MFWTEDINLLFKPILLPTDYMPIDEKLNAITRLIIFVCLILALILQDTKILLLMIILVIIVAIIYQFQKNIDKDVSTFLDEKRVEIIDSKVCKKPTKENPFMNPNIVDMHSNHNPACPISDPKTNDKIEELFNSSVFKNADDIYDRTTSMRQFYTVPATKIPNDQSEFAHWLYDKGKSCKEDNSVCYNNLHIDLRSN
jgi:hypothetical protein